MTRARSTLISLSDTPWYHLVNRCVRRAFLCGDDQLTGKNFDHRRGWIADRVKQLAGVFAIDVAAYAVMSNHYHLVVRVDVQRTQAWGRDEVLQRWTQLFSGPKVLHDYFRAVRQDELASLDAATMLQIEQLAELYRARLMDISWFMRVLNESIARPRPVSCFQRAPHTQATLCRQAWLSALSRVNSSVSAVANSKRSNGTVMKGHTLRQRQTIWLDRKNLYSVVSAECKAATIIEAEGEFLSVHDSIDRDYVHINSITIATEDKI